MHTCMHCGNDERHCTCRHNPIGGADRLNVAKVKPNPKPFAWCVPNLHAFSFGDVCPCGWIGKAMPLYAAPTDVAAYREVTEMDAFDTLTALLVPKKFATVARGEDDVQAMMTCKRC